MSEWYVKIRRYKDKKIRHAKLNYIATGGQNWLKLNSLNVIKMAFTISKTNGNLVSGIL